MTDIEQKALALVNEVNVERGYIPYSNFDAAIAALCRAIEQHEAFRQEVSDAVVHCHACSDPEAWTRIKFELERFIIPAPKPDPLVEALVATDGLEYEPQAQAIRAALKACGFEIKEK